MYDNGAAELAPRFDALLVAMLPSLRQQAIALTRHRSDADDLVQATIANALAAKDSFEVGTNFRAWMTRILRNRFFSNVRSRRTMVDIDDAPASLFGRSGGQEETIAVQELQHHLLRLPANQRQILLMISIDGLSYDDASEHLGVAAGTLKCRVFRARAQLQDWMVGKSPSTDSTDAPVRQRSNGKRSARRTAGCGLMATGITAQAA